MKTLKRTLKIIGIAAASFIIILFLLAVLTQTQFFKERLRTFLVSTLTARVNGSLYIGRIGGNFLDGFTIDSVALYDTTGAFFTSGKLTCNYDPLTLLEKKIKLEKLIVEQPAVHFTRSHGGKWNISQIIKAPETAGSGKFDWTVSLENIELKNANVTLLDSASLADSAHWNMPDEYFEYHDFQVCDLNAKMSVILKSDRYYAHIEKLSFSSPGSNFTLSLLKGEFELNEKGLTARNTIIQTGRSYIELDAGLRDSRLFSGIMLESMQHDSTRIKFRAKNIDLRELKSFIPQIAFLEGSVSLDLDASGEFGNLQINHLNVRTFASSLNLSGNIRNLHKPGQLYLAVIVGDSKITPADASKLLPPFNIPKLDSAGQLSIYSEFTGRPTSFKTKTSLKGQFGQIDASGTLDLEKDLPAYNFSLAVARLNLAHLLGDRKFETSIYAKGTIEGAGFSIRSMAARSSITIDSSVLQGKHPLTASDISISVSRSRIEGKAALHSRLAGASIRSELDLSDSLLPHFGGDLTLSSFDLATLLNNNYYESSISMQMTFSGSGHDIDDASAEATLTLLPSMYRGHQLSAEEIRLSLDQNNPENKSLSVESSIADIDLKGKFDLDLAAATLIYRSSVLADSVLKHASPPMEETPGARTKFPALRPHTPSQREMDFGYEIKIKNLDPLFTVLEIPPGNAQARLHGVMKEKSGQMSLSCEGVIDEFFVGTMKGGILLNGSKVSVSIDSLTDVNTLDRLYGNIDLSIESGMLNNLRLQQMNLRVHYDHMTARVTAESTLDSMYAIRLESNTSVQPHTYAIDIDSFTVSRGGYSWCNDQDVQLRVNYDGIRIMHGFMKRGGETFSLTGALHPSGELDFEALLKNFDLEGINILSRNRDLSQPGRGFAGAVNAGLRITGSTGSPVMAFRLSGEDTYFRQTRVGRVDAAADYSNRRASIDISVKGNPSDTLPSLALRGTLPIDLAFAGVGERFQESEQHLELISDGFDVSVLNPILPDLENLTGSLRCSVGLAGTPKEPRYKGSITLKDIRFTLLPNNIDYSISGDLEPSGDRLLLKQFTVKNTSPANLTGEAGFTGSISVVDYNIASFDLLARGTLLLMTDASRKTIPSMYGTLLTETGPDGLSLKGTLQRPYLSGKLYIRDANLVFPPARKTGTESSGMSLNYFVVDDTLKKASDPRHSKLYFGRDSSALSFIMNKEQRESPLLDRLRYNLSVETRGTTAVTMIFTPATNEELYAELDGKVTAVNDQGTPNIYGEIEVSSRSYYNFFRRFDATGKLKFVGQWDNPEMDIQATYEGYRQESAQQALDQQSPAQKPQIENQPSQEQKVIVELKIGGTRFEPKLAMTMKVQLKPGETPVDWSTQAKGGDVQSDAISFIVTGKFRDQLSSKEQQEFTDLGSATGSSVASNLLSSIFSDVLRKEFPFIRRADVTYQGGSFQQGTSVNVSATAFKGYLRVGGKILNDIGNANVSYQLSLGDVFNSTTIRNLFLEIQRKVEGDNPEDKKLTNEARLYYRFSF